MEFGVADRFRRAVVGFSGVVTAKRSSDSIVYGGRLAMARRNGATTFSFPFPGDRRFVVSVRVWRSGHPDLLLGRQCVVVPSRGKVFCLLVLLTTGDNSKSYFLTCLFSPHSLGRNVSRRKRLW